MGTSGLSENQNNQNKNDSNQNMDSFDSEFISSMRTFYLNRLDKPDSNAEGELYKNLLATELIRTGSDDSISSVAKHSSAPVKYFEHDSIRGKLRRILIRNSTARLAFTIFDLIVRVLICLLYVVRVIWDEVAQYRCEGDPCPLRENDIEPQHNGTAALPEVNWYLVLWVQRPLPLWIAQVTFAVITFSKTLLTIYIGKGNRCEKFLQGSFILEVCSSLPLISTVFYPPLLRHMFAPTFLTCWLAKKALDKLFNDLHRTRQRFQLISVTLSQQCIILTATVFCLIFTTICGVQHIQRASSSLHLNMFQSIYFVIVTFSTVGYGDISPDIWPSQVFMLLMICIAFAFIPMQIQMIASTWIERAKLGREYSERRASDNKHVVVLSRTLQTESVMDFLLEFYAHPKLEEHCVVLMAADAMDSTMQVILKDPKWSQRVVYMRGSALKDTDLKRCRIDEAEACFILAPRHISDRSKADQHSILRSWAVKDFAPKCKQYIQLFKPENKIHVKFAEHVVCEDEFKYALLANNCLYPGLSTLVSLLVHTSGGFEGELATDQWQQTYGRHSGNEIYHIQLGRSSFFGRYEGKKFTEASADAHQRFGISLVAVLDTQTDDPHLQLNPGPNHILKNTDFCFYMSVTKEEYAKIQPDALKQMDSKSNRAKNMERMAAELQRMLESEDEDEDYGEEESVFNTITIQQGYELANRVRRATYSPGDNNTSLNSFHQMAMLNSIGQNSPGKNDIQKQVSIANHNDSNSHSTHTDESLTDSHGDNSHYFDHVDDTDPIYQCFSTKTFPGKNDIQKRVSIANHNDSNSHSTHTDESLTDNHGDNSHHFDHVDGTDPILHEQVLEQYNDMGQDEFITGPPPVTLYVGSKRALCHLMKEPRPICCLEWGLDCCHCKYKNTNDDRWSHQLIILASEKACNGIYNFIVPLRSQFIGMKSLCPIILLLAERPDKMFLETISYFPLVYWMYGKITSVDDLLKAGINKASHLVVVNKEGVDSQCEDTLADSETIVAVQTIFKLFPNANIITELNQASNMRFMHFRAHDEYSQKISDLERKLKHSMTSNLSHIFRLPFAAGHVFSASMLDTLLYQTFVKGYLITFVRLLLGIDAEHNSGHLSSIRIKRQTLVRYRTYGELYHALCSTTGEIPIALYRTDVQTVSKPNSPTTVSPTNNNSKPHKRHMGHDKKPKKVSSSLNMQKDWRSNPEQTDISDLIRNRMKSLDLSVNDYCDYEYKKNDICYVILNPSPKRKLRIGDLVYVIQPSSMVAIPSKMNRFKHSTRTRTWTPTLKRTVSENEFSDSENMTTEIRERSQSMSTGEKKKSRFEVGAVQVTSNDMD